MSLLFLRSNGIKFTSQKLTGDPLVANGNFTKLENSKIAKCAFRSPIV